MGARTQLNGFYVSLVVVIAIFVTAGTGTWMRFLGALGIGLAVCLFPEKHPAQSPSLAMCGHRSIGSSTNRKENDDHRTPTHRRSHDGPGRQAAGLGRLWHMDGTSGPDRTRPGLVETAAPPEDGGKLCLTKRLIEIH